MIGSSSSMHKNIEKEFEISYLKEMEIIGDEELFLNSLRKYSLKCISSDGLLLSFSKAVKLQN